MTPHPFNVSSYTCVICGKWHKKGSGPFERHFKPNAKHYGWKEEAKEAQWISEVRRKLQSLCGCADMHADLYTSDKDLAMGLKGWAMQALSLIPPV